VRGSNLNRGLTLMVDCKMRRVDRDFAENDIAV
jgi:hypothetical protein